MRSAAKQIVLLTLETHNATECAFNSAGVGFSSSRSAAGSRTPEGDGDVITPYTLPAQET
eukprot:2181504-Lingulodinium_polyedra.AAC.1